MGLTVSIVAQERKPEEKTQSLTINLRGPAQVDSEKIVEALGAEPDVRRVRVEEIS
jgi:hypothetical protein